MEQHCSLDSRRPMFKNSRPVPSTSHSGYVEPTFAGWAHLVVEPSDEVSGAVFLGPLQSAAKNSEVASALRYHNVTGIVNCTTNLPCHYSHRKISGTETRDSHSEGSNEVDSTRTADVRVEYCRVPVNDVFCADILPYLAAAALFIHEHTSRGGSILVHCAAGISRSSTIVLAYLVKYHGMTRDEAYIAVKQRRPQVNPNPGFWTQLATFEEECRGRTLTTSNDMDEDVLINRSKWAMQSCARYDTLGGMRPEKPENSKNKILADDEMVAPKDGLKNDLYRSLIFEGLPRQMDRQAIQLMLDAALDYLWSRGVLQVEVEWLSALCEELSESNACDLCPADVCEMVFVMLQEGSDFREAWSCEVYPSQIERVRSILSNSKASNS